MLTIGELYRSNWPPASYPTFTKQYEVRSHLPIRYVPEQTLTLARGILSEGSITDGGPKRQQQGFPASVI